MAMHMSHPIRHKSIPLFGRGSVCRLILRHAMIGVVAVGLLSACSGRVAVYGNTPDPERLAEILPGEISRAEVRDALGSPSTVGNYEKKETWYYYSEKTETYAFFEPTVKERKVIFIEFDAKGVVSKIGTVGLDDSAEVNPVDRETPSVGAELTVIEQIIANFQKLLPPE